MELGGAKPAGSSRTKRLDPFALPVRFTACDAGADERQRQVELTREHVVLRRAVRGIHMHINLPVTAFLGVALTLVPSEGGEGDLVTILLEHRDHALSVPLYAAPEGDDIVAEWQLWGRVLEAAAARRRARWNAARAICTDRQLARCAPGATAAAAQRRQDAPAFDPDAAAAQAARRQHGDPSRRARDHRAQLKPRGFTLPSNSAARHRRSGRRTGSGRHRGSI